MLKRAVCWFGIAILVALGLCSAWAESDDPVVVRVGDVTFTRSQVGAAVDTNLTVSELMNEEYLTDEEKLRQRDEIIEQFVGDGLIWMKLKEAGKDSFTDEEDETLRATAVSQYEALWQGIWERAQQTEEDFTEEQVTEFMQEQGYSSTAIYEALKLAERRYRAMELYCPNVTVTEDMVEKYYEIQFLGPDKARYENDLDLYEREVLALNNESFYTPAGYRAIQQILLDYPDAVTKALSNERLRINETAQKVAEAIQAVTEAALTGTGWDDITGPRADYEAAAEEMKTAQQEYIDKRDKLTLPLIQSTVDEISAAFEAGIDFTSLIQKYSTDKSEQNLEKGGYPVHPDSQNWPTEFLEAVRTLQKPGDISKPVLSDMGVHILYYASDIPSGAHKLSADERRTLNTSAMYYYQIQELEKLMEDWRGDYEIETHPELLDD